MIWEYLARILPHKCKKIIIWLRLMDKVLFFIRPLFLPKNPARNPLNHFDEKSNIYVQPKKEWSEPQHFLASPRFEP